MNPLTIGLSLAGLFGGFLGGKGQKQIDPNTLARLFGPQVLAQDTQSLYQTLANSPMFQQIMSSASARGTAAGNQVRANFARAGLSNSGVGALGSAVSRDFGSNMILGARANLWNNALAAARESLAQRASIYGQSALMRQQTPTMAQQFGQALTGLASTGLTAALAPKSPATNTNDSFSASGAFIPRGTSVISAPMRRVGGETRLRGGWEEIRLGG